MDSSRDDAFELEAPAAASTHDDLSAVAWVHEELRKSLDGAHKALRRFLKDNDTVSGSDIGSVEPGILRTARAQLHQGVGALELVGLPGPATVLRASEAAVQRSIARPRTLSAELVGDIERSSFALLDFLSRLLAGKPVSPLSLFPQYRAVQEAIGAERVHPADLWAADWRWRDLPDDDTAQPRAADAATRAELEAQLLGLMRGAAPTEAATRMSELCAGLGVTAADPQVRTFWSLAAAMFEAQGVGLLGFDVFSKRVASRLLAQFRILQRGDTDVSERLARDLLFFCAQSAAPTPAQPAPRLARVRDVYALPDPEPVDYLASGLGRFDPATITHARKRLAAAKEAWSAVANGETHRLAGLAEPFSLVGDSLRRLFPFGDAFAGELLNAVAQTQRTDGGPPAELAMEVATSLLYVEAALEDGDFDNPAHAERVQRLAERLGAVRRDMPSEPLEPWMEELYRRVSDRQTMGSVVQELRASLGEVEASIDRFFRDPSDPAPLAPVPAQLSSMRGVLSVLGMDPASSALLRMRDEVDGLASTQVDPERVRAAGVFDRIAGNLSALGFMIDMLSVQPQMAKSLFAFDAESGMLAPVMGRSAAARPTRPAAAPTGPRLIEQAQQIASISARDDVALQDLSLDLERLSHEAQAADERGLAAAVSKAQQALHRAGDDGEAAREELSGALGDFLAHASALDTQGPLGGPVALPPTAPPRAVESVEDDVEMREIFLEEAREVIGDAQTACGELGHAPDNIALVTTVRRAFHTLKGSARMVGLVDFGEAAWAGEQIYNAHLAEQGAAAPALIEFTRWSLGYLAGWVDEIAAGSVSAHDAATVKAAAERLAGAGEAPSALPVAATPSASELAAEGDWTLENFDFDAPMETVEAAAEPADAEPTAPADPLFAPFELADAAPAAPELPASDAPAPRAPAPVEVASRGARPSLLLPPDLPSAADLELGTPPAAPGGGRVTLPEPLPEVVEIGENVEFELDLAGLEATPAGPATPVARTEFIDVPALYSPFEDTPVPPLERTLVNPRFADSSSVDLDLGEFGVPPLVEPLTPSGSGDALPTQSGLLLDLGSGEAKPASTVDLPTAFDDAAAQHVDLSIGADTAPADDAVRTVGPLRIGIPLFNIYLNEADELSRRLSTELAEWAHEVDRPVGETAIAFAHSLAGSSATVGFADLSQLARTLEHSLARSQAIGHGDEVEAQLFNDTADEIRGLLHQFAAGFLKAPSPELLVRLAAHERDSALALEAKAAASELEGFDTRAGVDAAIAAEDSFLISLDLPGEGTTDPAHVDDVRAAAAAATNEAPPAAAAADDELRAATDIDAAASDARTGADALQIEATPAAADLHDDAPAGSDAAPMVDADADALEFELSGLSTLENGMPVTEPAAVDAAGEPAGADLPEAVDGFADLPAEAFAALFAGAPVADAVQHGAPRTSGAVADASAERPSADHPAEQPTMDRADEPSSIDLADGQLARAATDAAPTMASGDAQLEGAAEARADTASAPVADAVAGSSDETAAPADATAAPVETATATPDEATVDAAFDRLGMTELKPLGALPVEPQHAPLEHWSAADDDDEIDAVDAVDDELFEIFEEEAIELLPQLAAHLREWADEPAVGAHPAACMRTLHTLKGSARLAGAMRIGEMAHRLESGVERIAASGKADAAAIEPLQARSDAMSAAFEALRQGGAVPVEPAETPRSAAFDVEVPAASEPARAAAAPRAEAAAAGPLEPRAAAPYTGDVQPLPAIDWARFLDVVPAEKVDERQSAASQSAVRVRGPLLDRLVNQAGEVSITRSRIEAGVGQIKSSLADLAENLERLRGQLRDIELQGELQMTSRMEAAKAASQEFDALEFDRFTRFQELTRMMAESVNDVATVQRTLQRGLENTEDELVAQARLTRGLQDDLLRTRMIEFEGLSDRLYRVVRVTAKETGKQVRLDIVGGSIEVDRGVLDRMVGAFEHLLRNCVTHGIETPAERSAAGKDPTGSIVVALSHEGNEVGVEFRDDGAGLDLERIRAKAVAMGLIGAASELDDAALANLIFTPGFSTASTVTELAGRGVGMDVVRSDVIAMGGRIETATERGQGTSFKLILPLTTAVTQVVMLRCGSSRIAVPSTLVEIVRRADDDVLEASYASGAFVYEERALPFFWLGALLQISPRPAELGGRTKPIVIIRSAQQRIAVHVDDVLGNQEVVVKNLGPQLSRLPGLAGVTLLASGEAALIYNPVALATLYGDSARAASRIASGALPQHPAALLRADDVRPAAPLVLVVDDSLTVRRVTQRLLVREGYRVVLAKDGLDALERLAEETPAVVLSDIEMPRMDGFDLVRNIRSDARWPDLPIVMITSRIAQKHRDHAAELGVDHYLGKPYSEDELLALVGRYAGKARAERALA
ncbi:Hpt domain-containing protein [Piscinibacter koreensis]|uniref:Chemotaxis protein CheA n=1 Tax=Piscinibacter koreensis TaxID=2742824 RepID=A0A7Y6NPW1_9BURK|nr:Hpt domain-containing protein [Schlegelella koreensis]NUZ07057.1 Hpt domain-containing protein [Schlegelella koreensis]